MNINAVTPQDILSMGPCSDYTLEFIQTFGETMSAVEILKLESVSLADRSWLAAHLPAKYVEPWREKVLTRCITNHALGCGIPKVEQWAAKWLSGEDRSQAAAAAAAEAAAARAAEARAATWASAWAVVAAAAAARAAAWAATWASAWAVVAAAAAKAARAAARARAAEAEAEAARARAREYELQIQDMITVLEADNQK